MLAAGQAGQHSARVAALSSCRIFVRRGGMSQECERIHFEDPVSLPWSFGTAVLLLVAGCSMRRFGSWYARFSAQRPVAASVASTGVIFGAGDLLAQAVDPPKEPGPDALRCARSGVYGSVVLGPFLGLWYTRWLPRLVPGTETSFARIWRMVLYDQVPGRPCLVLSTLVPCRRLGAAQVFESSFADGSFLFTLKLLEPSSLEAPNGGVGGPREAGGRVPKAARRGPTAGVESFRLLTTSPRGLVGAPPRKLLARVQDRPDGLARRADGPKRGRRRSGCFRRRAHGSSDEAVVRPAPRAGRDGGK